MCPVYFMDQQTRLVLLMITKKQPLLSLKHMNFCDSLHNKYLYWLFSCTNHKEHFLYMIIFNIETLRFKLQILGESVSESHEYSTAKEPIVVFFFAKVT